MQLYTFSTAGSIVFGCESIHSLAKFMPMIGKVRSVLVVAQPSMLRNGIVEEMTNQLKKKGISFSIVTGVMNEPTTDNIEALYRRVIGCDADALIGIGGGSVLDATKLLSVLWTNDISLKQMLGVDLIPGPGLPTILIPTTAGTGSEVTPNAIVTLPAEELKIGIVSRHLYPRLAIIDPTLTLTLPKSTTAATGMDAFTHALESFISKKANPLSDLFALESIRLISRSIVTAYQDGSSLRAREDMLIGSLYGGLALANSGTAAVHALAYPLGGKFDFPHGAANAILLPHVLAFNLDAIGEKMVQIADAMGLHNNSSYHMNNAAQSVIEQVMTWIQELNMPQDLTKFGVTRQDVDSLAEAAMKVTRLLNNNPKTVTLEDARQIYSMLIPA